MRYLTAAGVALLGLLSMNIQAEEKTKDSKAHAEQLVGTYEIISGEKEGKEIESARLKDVRVQIAANAITTYDKDKKEIYAASYELDTSHKPWRLTMTATLTPVDGKGTKAEGLIEKTDNETVKLIYALPGGEAPTEFRAHEKQQLFVLKRLDKENDEAKRARAD